jgi:hypothetical protein
MAGATYRGPVSSSHPDPEPAPPPDADAGEPEAAGAAPKAHAFLLYNAARLAILAIAFAVFALVGFRGIALLIVAFLVSGAVSYLALYRLRGDAASGLASLYWRVNDRIDARSRGEDDD